MKYTLDRYEFSNLFDQFNRADNFSREARELLFDHFEQLEEDTGIEFNVDIIAICCDYSEETLQEIIDNYSIDIDPEEDMLEQVKEYLEENTLVIGVTGDDESIVYQVF